MMLPKMDGMPSGVVAPRAANAVPPLQPVAPGPEAGGMDPMAMLGALGGEAGGAAPGGQDPRQAILQLLMMLLAPGSPGMQQQVPPQGGGPAPQGPMLPPMGPQGGM